VRSGQGKGSWAVDEEEEKDGPMGCLGWKGRRRKVRVFFSKSIFQIQISNPF
jgi:hypothetical protein